jgi:hypothetical protein
LSSGPLNMPKLEAATLVPRKPTTWREGREPGKPDLAPPDHHNRERRGQSDGGGN